jgi:hypothetical protein
MGFSVLIVREVVNYFSNKYSCEPIVALTRGGMAPHYQLPERIYAGFLKL